MADTQVGTTTPPNPVVTPVVTTTTTPAATTTTPAATPADATLEAQLLTALSQGGTGGSIGQQQTPILTAQTSGGTPGIFYIALVAAAGAIVFLLAKRKE
jgi:hypothetical protein